MVPALREGLPCALDYPVGGFRSAITALQIVAVCRVQGSYLYTPAAEERMPRPR